VAGRIEDYAVVGDMQSVALVSADIGGMRNWDYRYCWLRDAAITLEALFRTGYLEEAKAWRLWLGRAIAGDPEDIQIDAAVLLIPDVGFLPADDPRVVSTMKVLQRDLMRDGFLRRYELPSGGTSEVDGLAGSEGAFLACSFWLADALELSGRHSEAVELFERLLALRNDVGLLSEEYDPGYGRLVGNMPQAFSHVALVQTALNLEGHAEEHRRGPWDERRSVPG
jgi:GH15 family glucan-1,4-alpha-glucosidase